MRIGFSVPTATLLLLFGATTLASHVAAQNCTFETIATATEARAFIDFIDLDNDGGRLVFDSFGDPAGDNPDEGTEVFLYDSTTGIEQLTDSGNLFGFFTPEISGDGQRVMFLSAEDPLGDNPEGNEEIFIWQSDGQPLLQITSTVDSFYGAKDIDDNGSTVSYTATGASVDPVGNPDGSAEMYVQQVGDPSPQAASNSDASALYGSNAISADGSQLVFSGDGDPVGDNSDGGWDLFEWREGVGTVQLTDFGGTDRVRRVDISLVGTRIAFASNADPLGTNPANTDQVFLFDDGNLVQITTDDNLIGPELAISGNGNAIYFASTSNLTGRNGDGSAEFFSWTGTGDFAQLTDFPNPVTTKNVAVNRDGTRVAVRILDGGQDTILLGECAEPGIVRAIPALDDKTISLLILLLMSLGIYALRQQVEIPL